MFFDLTDKTISVFMTLVSIFLSMPIMRVLKAPYAGDFDHSAESAPKSAKAAERLVATDETGLSESIHVRHWPFYLTAIGLTVVCGGFWAVVASLVF